MARLDLAYARSLLGIAEPADLVRVVVKRVAEKLSRGAARPSIDADAIAAAADALGRAPRIFATGGLRGTDAADASDGFRERYRELFPEALARFRTRAAAILAHQIDVFGEPRAVGDVIDWKRDPLTGKRCDGEGLFPDGVDPKGCWELARVGHLVELGAAARLIPSLAAAARDEVVAELSAFIDANPCGRGIHYASPLEVAMRAVHWLAAVELCGGAGAFPRAFVEKLAATLLADAHFLTTHLEDRGIVPANHLLGNWVGVWVIGLALDGAPRARRWQDDAARALTVEAKRQVGRDGAHFEASTAYHRWALELMLVAHLWARAADRPSPVAETLHEMFIFTRNYLGPDGCEPAFGDGDDARLYPIVPRAARDHSYLVPIGATLFGDPELRGSEFCEEALWLVGPRAWKDWSWLPPTAPPRSASFPTGGVHILRSDRWQVELRSGSYGQKGVGGHAHNDQLALVAWLDGAPLIVDAGTGSYATDMVVRDRFRGTAAHSTVIIDGQEQSPILDGRPFALIDRARAPRVRLEDTGSRATLVGEHAGYERLPSRVRHRRQVTLRRDLELLIVEDALSGQGKAGLELRWQLAQPVRRGLSPEARERVEALEPLLGRLDFARALTVGHRDEIAILGNFPDDIQVNVMEGFFSPSYGRIEPIPLVSYTARSTFPRILRTIFIRLRSGQDRCRQ